MNKFIRFFINPIKHIQGGSIEEQYHLTKEQHEEVTRYADRVNNGLLHFSQVAKITYVAKPLSEEDSGLLYQRALDNDVEYIKTKYGWRKFQLTTWTGIIPPIETLYGYEDHVVYFGDQQEYNDWLLHKDINEVDRSALTFDFNEI